MALDIKTVAKTARMGGFCITLSSTVFEQWEELTLLCGFFQVPRSFRINPVALMGLGWRSKVRNVRLNSPDEIPAARDNGRWRGF
jgi:hypothetical protein